MVALAVRYRQLTILLAAVVLTTDISQDKSEDKEKTWTVKLAEGARDVHPMELTLGEQIQIILTGSPYQSDVDLFIIDPEGKEVARDTSSGPDGFATFKVTKRGKYRAELRNTGRGASTATVFWDTVKEAPTSWTVEMPGKRRYSRAVLLQKGQKAVVTLTGKNPKGDVDLFVFYGRMTVGTDTSPGPNGKVEFTAEATGVYTITLHNDSRQTDVSTVEVRSAKRN
jgi:hypothetical protein